MPQPLPTDDSSQRKQDSAARALAAYRERRRRRRADDTFFGSADVLRRSVEAGLDTAELDRRRIDIVSEAATEGVPLDLAELLYDIAWEEGLDPALGFELVRTGLGVAPPDGGITNAPSAPATDRYLPPWMFPAAPTDELLRERMLRISFRRLRSILEEEQDLDAAFRRFASEPDVGHNGY